MPIATKPYQLKAWTDLHGLYPLLLDFGKVPSRKNMSVHLDFSQVYHVDAIGASIFLARVLQFIENANHVSFTISFPESVHAERRLKSLGILEHLNLMQLEPQREQDLFNQVSSDGVSQLENEVKCSADEHEKLIVLVPGESRSKVIAYAKSEIKLFLNHSHTRRFAHEQFMIVLLEMVKNTLDHSGKPALLALYANERPRGGSLRFAYCDTGLGIGRTVRDYLDTNAIHDEKLVRLKKKGGFSDILHWALQPGSSTKVGNGVNFGLGLMLIVEGARNFGMRLSLKDADSIWQLGQMPSQYSHADIRKYGTATCAAHLMMFSGEMEFPDE